MREVLASEETLHGTDIAAALRFLNQVQKKKAVVFLVSDFMDRDYLKELRVTARKHDVVCCPISDPREERLEDAGLLEVQDPETGDLILVDTGSPALREAFRKSAADDLDELQRNLKRNKIDSMFLSTSRPLVDDVRRLFRQRQVRAGRG